MSYIAVQIPELYPYVLLLAGGLTAQCLIFGFIAGGKRSTLFSKEYMDQFADDHQREMHQEIKSGGYPDMGNGLYSLNLSYKNWMEFQLDQRQHKNYLEVLTMLVFCTLICGLVFP